MADAKGSTVGLLVFPGDLLLTSAAAPRDVDLLHRAWALAEQVAAPVRAIVGMWPGWSGSFHIRWRSNAVAARHAEAGQLVPLAAEWMALSARPGLAGTPFGISLLAMSVDMAARAHDGGTFVPPELPVSVPVSPGPMPEWRDSLFAALPGGPQPGPGPKGQPVLADRLRHVSGLRTAAMAVALAPDPLAGLMHWLPERSLVVDAVREAEMVMHRMKRMMR